MNKNEHKPEWAPEGAGSEFSSKVVKGVEGGHDGMPGEKSASGEKPAPIRRKKLTVDDYVQGVLSGDRTILGRAITLVESNSPAHHEQAQEMLKKLMPHTSNSIRIGVSGLPGAGKSTFIEAFGNYLCDCGSRVAVLAVDPSSSITRGSILGDKTRMEKLAHRPEAFIRPSPTGGTLGGVAGKSRETMLVCEAAGYDVILVETVGVGQSEVAVRSMVDFFLLVLITGAGDDLQGIKRGIMELCDTVLINKADGDNKPRAMAAKVEFEQVLHYLQPATEGWSTRAHACSSITGEGIPELWDIITEFRKKTGSAGVFEKRRRNQSLEWVYTIIHEYLRAGFFKHPAVREIIPQIEEAVKKGDMSPTRAVNQLVKRFEGKGD